METRNLQEDLKEYGYVVFKTPLCKPNRRESAVNAFNNHFKTSPELLDPNPDDSEWTPIKGGFAACGHPSSFHHPFVRKMREAVMAWLLRLDVMPLHGRRLEQLFDRILYRTVGQSFSGEGDHRDNSPHAKPGDDIFGSFVNLDNESQFFLCAPKTHTETSDNFGFATIKDAEELARLDPLFKRIEVPPGCMIVFYERIVHRVAKSEAKHTMRRIFFGWRITDHSDPMFGNDQTLDWIAEQAVPKIKSDQDPLVYPSCYWNFPRHFKELTKWSERTYARECIYQHTVKSGEFAGQKMARVKASMDSLSEYGLKLHAEYDEHEVRILFPRRKFELRTFFGKRKRFDCPGPKAWARYEEAKRARPDEAKRPVPLEEESDEEA